MRKRLGRFSWVMVLALAIAGMNAQAQTTYTILKDFVDFSNDGAIPEGQPVLVNDTLYGCTFFGGSFSNGAIFQVSTNGSGFNLVYSFQDPANGANPYGSLVYNNNDGTLYGMTFNGGTNDGGVIFSWNTRGLGFAPLHAFQGGDDDGLFPDGSLTVDPMFPTVYGMTAAGGTNDGGVIFTMNTDGSQFTVLHSFAGAPDDGDFPNEGVILNGSTLYGTTFFGGTNDSGAVFAVGTDGSNYTNLYSFAGGTNDGAFPAGKLTLNGSTLYGITINGGTNDEGTVFAIKTDGSNYAVLHHFVGGTNDGAFPQFGSLAIQNSVIYGATLNGGTSDVGVVYQMNVDGSNFNILHSFDTNGVDATFPFYGPIISPSNVLYGTTVAGGSTNFGALYALQLPVPGPTNVISNFFITAITIQTTDVVITWTTTSTGPQTNRVQFTSGDANGGYNNNFIDLSPVMILTNIGTTVTNYVDMGGATNSPSRFYRVRIVP